LSASANFDDRHDALSGLSILVVEDEYFVADDLGRALRRLGVEIIGPFSDTASALARVQSEDRIDAAVLDINLNGNMAYAVADALEERGVPFFFATGYSQDALPPRYHNVPRWEKPFDAEQLALAISRLASPS
jgi:CheY-like chemotaxis protein